VRTGEERATGTIAGNTADRVSAGVRWRPDERRLPASPLRGVRWTLIFAGFLAYVGVIVTYKVPIGDATMVVAVLGLVLQRDRLRIPPYVVLLGLLVGWSAVGLLESKYPQVVWDHLVDSIKMLLVALVAANALRTRSQMRLFSVFFLGCFALFPVRGALFNYFIAHYTLFGRALWNYIYQNPNDLAALCLLQFSMAVGLAATEPRGAVRWAARAGVVVLPLLILLTQSRGAFLALVAMITVMIATRRGRRVRLLVSIGIVGVIVASVIPTSAWQRFQRLSRATSTSNLAEVDGEGSAKNRYAVWTVAFRMIGNRPLTGVGLGAYPQAHNDYTLTATDVAGGARGYRDTHSTYFNLAAELGIPGLLLFLGIVGTTLLHSERARRAYSHTLPDLTAQLLYLELGLFGFLVAGVFGSFAKLSFLYLHIALIWGWAEACHQCTPGISTSPQGGGRRRVTAGWRTPRPVPSSS
jgi:O-antigen ligase